MNKQFKKEKAKGIASVLGAILFAAKVILAQFFGYEIPQELIDNTISAVLAMVAVYGAWRNNYITNKGKKQYKILENPDLQ